MSALPPPAHSRTSDWSPTIPPIILIVDDHDRTLECYETALYAHGYWVVRAGNAEEALEHATYLQPDAIITDLELRDRSDGADLIRQLGADIKLRPVPVLVVTGRNPRELPSLTGLGITALLMKPLADATLIDRVDRILDQVRGSRLTQRGGVIDSPI